jgi:hypothetical protein
MTARVILALAIEADDRFAWDRLLEPEMFSAGALEIKLGASSALRARGRVGPMSSRHVGPKMPKAFSS